MAKQSAVYDSISKVLNFHVEWEIREQRFQPASYNSFGRAYTRGSWFGGWVFLHILF